jgi:hypothetical protein
MAIMRLFLIALLAIAATSQSQPPAPTPAKPDQANQGKTGTVQNKADTDKSSPEQHPSPINQPTSEITTGNQQDYSHPSENATPTDWWARASTILITIFTFALAVLAGFQWRAMQVQAGHMREQADYMRSQLEAVIAKEKARLSIDVARQGLDLHTTPPPCTVTIQVTHHGFTNAFNVSGRGALVLVGFRDFPRDTTATFCGIDLPSVIKAGDTPLDAEVWMLPMMKAADVEEIDNERAFLHLVGVIKYQDFLDNWMTTPFWYVWESIFEHPGDDIPAQDFSGWEARRHPDLKE